jgi:hypothetical protein
VPAVRQVPFRVPRWLISALFTAGTRL